uniref:Tetraspanin n=1 Tax=Panagrolaimus sp. JU765 TaxID=591449 RepID=A0AC34R950_9BILA
MFYGLTDWLSEPTNGPNECCQCYSLKCKKLTMLIIMFVLTVLFGIVVLMLWTQLGAQLPIAIMSVVVFLQFACFLIAIPPFFDETKYKMLMPLVLIHCFAVGVYFIMAIFYLILLVVGKAFGGNLRNPEQSVFLPFAPTTDLESKYVSYMTENEYNLHVLGHILFLLPFQLFLTWIAYGTYVTFKNRTIQVDKNDGSKTAYFQNHGKRRQPPHNIVVLEQCADDALYGSKQTKLSDSTV